MWKRQKEKEKKCHNLVLITVLYVPLLLQTEERKYYWRNCWKFKQKCSNKVVRVQSVAYIDFCCRNVGNAVIAYNIISSPFYVIYQPSNIDKGGQLPLKSKVPTKYK